MLTTKENNFNKLQLLYCKFCNKECHSQNSLKQHEVRCKENPDRRDWNKLQNCARGIQKGDTWKTNPTVAKCRESLLRKYKKGYVSPMKGAPGAFLGKKHSEETKQKIGVSVSKSRIEGYRNGTITPASGIGRGKYSYIVYKNNTYMLRSTYEFIFALYLIYNNIDFKVEAIRVPAVTENPYAKTFISDFSYDNKVIEVKGISSKKDFYIKEAFENAGYEFVELYEEDIQKCKQYLQDIGIDIDTLLEKVIIDSNNKEYFRYIV